MGSDDGLDDVEAEQSDRMVDRLNLAGESEEGRVDHVEDFPRQPEVLGHDLAQDRIRAIALLRSFEQLAVDVR